MCTETRDFIGSTKTRKRLLLLLTAMVLLLTAATGFACDVATDKLAYQPGERVTLNGKQWQPQEWIKLSIIDTAGTRPVTEIDVTAGTDGTFRNDAFVVQEFDRDHMLVLTAKGATGSVAMVAFKVGVAPGALKCATLSAVSPTLYGLAPGQTVTCSIEGATDLSEAQKAGSSPVEVIVKGSQASEQAEVISVTGSTIVFKWTAPATACDTALVSYGPIKACDPRCGNCTTFHAAGNHANSSLLSNGSSMLPAGFRYNGSACGNPPRLVVEKLPKNGAFSQGSQVSYRIEVRNTAAAGAAPAVAVHLTDQLPGNGGLVWQNAATTQGTCVTPIVNNMLDCSLGDIPAQGSVTVTVTSTPTTPATACQCQPNLKALVTAQGGLAAEDYGFLTCTPPAGPPQLKVVKWPKDGTFSQGAQVSYVIEVSNPAPAGSEPAKNVKLTDLLPANGGLSWPFVTTTAGACSITGNTLNCALGDIAAGSTVTVVLNSTATTPVEACQHQPNPAAVATADGGLTARDSGSLTCIPSGAKLKVMKTPDNGTFNMGEQLRYTIVVSNPGTATASNVRLVDQLPTNGGIVWSSATPASCTVNVNMLDCSLGDIPAGGSVTVTVSTPAVTPDEACQAQPNPAAIATADGGLTARDSGSMTCTPPAAPKLSVAKTPDSGSFVQGGQVQYTIVVSNPGSATALNVMLADQLPTNGGLTWSSVTPSTCSINGSMLGCALGNIPAGGSVTVTVSTPATTPPEACQPQPNPAAIATAEGGLTARDSGSITCIPQGTPRLRVVKTPDNGTFLPGAQMTYKIQVSNPGTATAMNVMLTDRLPVNGGLTWTSVTPSSCTISGNLLSCSLGNIAAGRWLTVVVSTPASTPLAACQPQPNPAAIATADGGLRAQDAGSMTCVPVQAPKLRVVKTPDNGTFIQGRQARFNIQVSNPGTATARNVMLTDLLPTNGGLTWSSVTPSGCTITGNRLSCALGDIDAGRWVIVTVSTPTVTPPEACQAQPNPAAIATADGGLRAQDAGSLNCSPPQAPNLTIVKTPSTTTPAPGQQVTYSYTVTNSGTVTLTNIVVTDDNGTPENPSDDFTVGTVATLAPGASATLSAVTIPSNVSIAARLGSAGPSFFTVLSLGGDAAHDKAGIYCSIATVNGNLGIVGHGFFHNAEKCTENGDFYKGAAVLYQDLGGQLNGSIIVNDPLLNRVRQQAFSASSYFASLPVTPAVQAQFPVDGKIHNMARTITGQPGLNVVNLPAFSLSKGDLLFTGPPGTQFVLNIGGTFGVVTGNIKTAGGVGPYDIIYNITDPKASVGTDKYQQDVSGILLAPYNEIHAMYALFWRGQVIGAYNQEVIKLNYGTTIGAPNPPPPVVTNTATATAQYGTTSVRATATATVTVR